MKKRMQEVIQLLQNIAIGAAIVGGWIYICASVILCGIVFAFVKKLKGQRGFVKYEYDAIGSADGMEIESYLDHEDDDDYDKDIDT